MPFGLSNAPASFCRLMQLVFKDMQHTCCFVYLDDIIVFASTPEELIKRLDAVFTRLREHGHKTKSFKCVANSSRLLSFWRKSVTGRPRIACAMWRAFYGYASYYRRFVKYFAKIAEPLSRLTLKHNTFTWTDEMQESFDRLKRALMQTPTLKYPRPDIPSILDTDPSDVAARGVLSQVIDGKERPIAFFSKVLNGAQKNYPQGVTGRGYGSSALCPGTKGHPPYRSPQH